LRLDEFRNENGKLVLNKSQRETLEASGIVTVEQLATASMKEIMKLMRRSITRKSIRTSLS